MMELGIRPQCQLPTHRGTYVAQYPAFLLLECLRDLGIHSEHNAVAIEVPLT